MVRAMGFDVDDDKDPAPENIPEPNAPETEVIDDDGCVENQSWGWEGFCNRKRDGETKENAKVVGVSVIALLGVSLMEIFLLLVGRSYLEEIALKGTKENLDDDDFLLNKLLRYLGIWFFMATTLGCDRASIVLEHEGSIP